MWGYKAGQLLKREYWKVLVVTLCVALLTITCCYSFIRDIGIYDEGFALTNALRIMNGEVPFRDYWAAYPPGTSYVLMVFFSIFEPSLIVARTVNLAWTLILLGSFYVVARRFTNTWIGLVSIIVTTLWISASLYPSYSVTPALALIFLVLSLYFTGLCTNRGPLITLSGILGGLVVFFRHDLSAYLFIALCVPLLFVLKTRSELIGDLLRKNVNRFLLAYVLVTASALLLLVYKCGFDNFIQQTLVFPATGMRENRLLPFPGFFEFFHAWKSRWVLAWIVPVFVVAGGLYAWRTRKNMAGIELVAVTIFASMSLLLTVQSHNRLDMPHAAPSMILLMCFLLVIFGKTSFKEFPNNVVAGAFLVSFAIYSIGVTSRDIGYRKVIDCVLSGSVSTCIRLGQGQVEVVDYINSHYNKAEYIFVGNTRHDKIYTNDASLYFLLRRPIPIMWNEMHPGEVTTAPVQRAIIEQLDSKRVSVVVLADMPEPTEKNASSISSNVFLLDDYIKHNFHPVFSDRKYTVMQRTSYFSVVK
jgi:hypothetical protein